VGRRSTIRLVAASVLGILVLLAMAAPARGGSSSRRVFIPLVASAPPGCQPIPGASYATLPVYTPPPNPPAASNADINLEIRGWQQTNAYAGLVTYNGGSDPNAPQLNGLFTDNRLPVFSAVYQVYNWNWSTNSRGSLDTDWPVTLAGFRVQPGEVIQAPPSGYDVGQGYTAIVLYATTRQITLTYTSNDSIVYGYAVHVEGVCVEPSLLALYQQMDSAGRSRLPALSGRQPFGRANGAEIQVAIRDAGTFMDPRSQKDWWQAY
jgi:hypothetical protein